MTTHIYVDDGTRDHMGEGRCRSCGLPKANQRHTLPPRSAEEREHEARRMGEES